MIIFIVLLVGVGLLVYYGQRKVRQGELFYSGTVEATQSHLSFQTGGRVVRVAVREGEAATKDQLLAELDPAEFRTRIEQARANLDRSLKGQEQAETLRKVYEKTLPAEVARAEAGVRALASQLDELRAGSRTQDIERAKQGMQSAASVTEDAKKNLARYENLFRKGTVSEKELDAVRLRYETALREYERGRETYDLAREGSRAETIRTGEARLAEGQAVLTQARSNLLRVDAAKKEVEAARATVAAARAALDQARDPDGLRAVEGARSGDHHEPQRRAGRGGHAGAGGPDPLQSRDGRPQDLRGRDSDRQGETGTEGGGPRRHLPR